MRLATIVASVCLCMAMTATCSQASLIWTAGDPLTQGYNALGPVGTPFYTPDSPVPGILTQDTTSDHTFNAHYGLNAIAQQAEMQQSLGWFVEWRAKTIQSGGNPATNYEVAVQTADDQGGALVLMDPDGVRFYYGGATTVDGPDFAGPVPAYHTFRMTRDAGGTDFKFSIDGGAAISIPQFAPYKKFLEFGDGDRVPGGSIVEWDYVAVNTTPVPEPASIVLLLCSGLVGLAVSRKR